MIKLMNLRRDQETHYPTFGKFSMLADHTMLNTHVISNVTPGNHTFDPSKQFRLNRTDVHAGYISPPVNSQASKANIDWWNILTLIIATIIPITVLTILKYFCTNFYNTYCCTSQNQNSSPSPPSPTFRRSSSPKLKCFK